MLFMMLRFANVCSSAKELLLGTYPIVIGKVFS